MADLRSNFLGIKSPNPFWLASAPPTDNEINVVRAFRAGWGGVVWKTLGEDPPIVNVNGPRYGAIHGADRRLLGFNNIELITDRPLEVNLQEIKEVKRDWPDRAMVVSLMVPCTEESWKSDPRRASRTPSATASSSTSAARTACPSAAWARPSGQVPEYIEMVARWCKQHTRMPVIVKLTPNITDIRYPARAAHARRRGRRVADQHRQLDRLGRPRQLRAAPDHRRQGHPWRLLRPGGEADRAQHGRPRSPATRRRAACRSPPSAASPPGATRPSSSPWAPAPCRSAPPP